MVRVLIVLAAVCVVAYVRAIKLASSVEPAAGDVCIATGWGSRSFGGDYPQQLQAVDVSIVDRDSCKKIYGESAFTKNMICAGENGKDSCARDSGGPLVCNGVQAGVVPWGVGCDYDHKPGIYTNIVVARKWILQHTGV